MSDIPHAGPIIGEAHTVAQDVSCLRCGYNLRGLSSDSRCPECGSPVERSIQGDQLRFADPNWLRTLRRGVAFMLWNLLIIFAINVFAGVATTIVSAPVLVPIAGIVGAALGLAAMYLVTAPEPREMFAGQTFKLRKAVRILAIIGFAGVTCQQGFGNVGGLPVLVAGAFLTFVGAFGHVGLLALLRRFALRAPDFGLASQTRVVLWGYIIGYGGAALIGLLGGIWLATTGGGGAFAAGGAGAISFKGGTSFTTFGATAGGGAPQAPAATPGTGLPSVGGSMVPPTTAPATPLAPPAGLPPVPAGVGIVPILFACGFGLAMAVFGIWYIILLFRYHKLFKTAVAEAEHWSQAPATPPSPA
jgi:hypothetical protein